MRLISRDLAQDLAEFGFEDANLARRQAFEPSRENLLGYVIDRGSCLDLPVMDEGLDGIVQIGSGVVLHGTRLGYLAQIASTGSARGPQISGALSVAR